MSIDKNFERLDSYKQLIMPVEKPLPAVIKRAYDCYLVDSNDREYLDFSAGLAVNLLGYSNDEVRQVIKEAADSLIHCGSELVNEANVDLAGLLKSMSGFDSFFFSNSGSEANEAAIKLARKYASVVGNENKTKLVSFKGSFHGRSLLNISASGNPKHCEGFAPLVTNIVHADFNDIKSLISSIDHEVSAVIIETIQCRGGMREITEQFVNTLNKLRQEFKFLTIVDEVQTGTFRLNSLLSYSDYAIEADIVTLGKGIGGGLPIGITATTREIGRHLSTGSHGSTFGGGPLISSVALKVLKIISSEKFSEIMYDSSHYLRSRLVALRDIYPESVGDIVSRGMLFGFSLTGPASGRALEIEQIAFTNGLIIRISGDNTIRLTPPLCITRSHIDSAFDILKKSFNDLLTLRITQ